MVTLRYLTGELVWFRVSGFESRVDSPITRDPRLGTRDYCSELTLNLQFNLNGKVCEVDCEPQETLAEVLRNTLNLNGTKVSCEVQVCGACTVLVDGVPVSACTYLAYEARDKNVTTIEGLEKPDGTLHPLQQAFIDEFALQCDESDRHGNALSTRIGGAPCYARRRAAATRNLSSAFMRESEKGILR